MAYKPEATVAAVATHNPAPADTKVRITGSDGVLYAYASVVRNDTGDATFVTPAQ